MVFYSNSQGFFLSFIKIVKMLVLEDIFKNPNQSPSHFVFHEVRTFGIK